MFNVRRTDNTARVLQKYVKREVDNATRKLNVGKVVRGTASGSSGSPTVSSTPLTTANFLFILSGLLTQFSATYLRAEGGPVIEQDTTASQVILRHEAMNDPMYWL